MRRLCPEWFQERLTRAGGINPYGEPRFKLVWGQSETIRTGGYFAKDGFVGYRNIPAAQRTACWVIMMWVPPQLTGTPELWYRENRDEQTGLSDLGQYPHRGHYRVLHKLIHHELVGDEMVVYRLEPTHFIIDVMVPLIQNWQKVTDSERIRIVEDQLEQETEAYLQMAKDCYDSHRVSAGSPIVQKKIEFLERNMHKACEIASRTQLGLHSARA